MLDHIMKTAANNSIRQFETLDRVSRNVANINTTGYKTNRFEQYLATDGRLEGADRVDYAKGDAMVTKRPLDVAIDGHGFLPVTQPDGTTAYTRDGSFALNSEGYLMTHRGDMVGDGIRIPVNYENLFIKQDGAVEVQLLGEQKPRLVGQLSLVRFANPEGLKNIGYNKLLPTDASGEAVIDQDSKIRQGNLERSNVNVFHQVDHILRLNASVISNMRIIKFSDDIYRQAVNLKQ